MPQRCQTPGKSGQRAGTCGKLDGMTKPTERGEGPAGRQILVLHGPNLNLLGTREPGIYGAVTLDAINANLGERAAGASAFLSTFQSNVEGELVTRIQQAGRDGTDFIIINP